ncbi:MAG: ferredoxin domain-containing protein [Alkalispirochaeta sp.]
MQAMETIAELMEISAITAPKAVGENYVVTETITGDDLHTLATDMRAFGEESGKKNFDRDARNVQDSGAVVLIGLKDAAVPGLNCAACGHPVCIEINSGERNGEFLGPQCAIRLLDMGIAIGSAVKTAQMLNVDNRVMYRIGVSARRLGMIDADFVMGVPLAVSGKSPYFDR